MTDKFTNEAILARHRDYFRTVHPEVKAAAMRDGEVRRMALGNCQQQLREAIRHLQSVLNQPRTHAEQQAADTAARNWLESIGAEPA